MPLMLLTMSVGQMWADTYEQLTSIANIDESAEYVLGIDGTGFHYSGTSSWGLTALPSAQAPIKYTLKKANDGNSFTAKATISSTTYYLQVPTSNTFSMATSTGTNTDLIIGTTQVSGTNYAVANKTTTARHLRINGTSGLRSYAGTTGTMAYFYKVVSASPCTVTWHVNGNTTTAGNPTTNSSTGSQVTKLPTSPISSDCDGSKVFVGWTATEINGTTNTKPADLFTTAAESPVLTENTDFYAVFANASEGAPTWQKTTSIAVGDVVVFVNETNKYEMTGVSSNLGQATSYTSVQGTYPLTIVAGSTNGSFSFKNGSNYLSYSGSSNQLKTSADKDATSSWTISSSTNGNFKLANVNTTTRILQYNHNSGSPRWACYGNSSQAAFQIYKQTASINYSNYATSCCQPLAQINGSIDMNQNSAVLTWDDLGGVAESNPYAVTYRKGSEAYGSTNVGDITTNAQGKKTCTITGLECGTEYDFKIAVTGDGSHCDAEQVLEDQSTTKWNITYNLTNTVALSEGPAQGANACGEISASFTKNALYTFPENITVTIGGVEASSSTDYDWDANEGELLIDADKVTGNVVIAIEGVAPANPVVTPNPAALNFASVKKGAAVPAAQDIEITGQNLTTDLTVTSSDPALYAVSVKSGSLTPDGDKNASPVITVTPQAGITDAAGDKNATITISGGGLASNVVVNVTFNVQETYTVNWYVNGQLEHSQTDVANTDYDEVPSDFSAFKDCKDLTFVGWKEGAIDGGSTTSAPSLATIGTKITADKNYYAVFADGTPGSTVWEATALSDLGASDVFVIAETTGSHAMTNDNGTSSAPAATSITITDGKLSNAPANNLKWNISGNASDGYTFYPNGSTSTWLYCTNTNNGVRVGTNDNKTFVVEDGYLKHSETSRYVGVYNSQDWRCYTAHTGDQNNIKDQNFAYYKYTEVPANWTKWYTTCPHYYTISLTNDGIVEGKGSFVADKASALVGESVKLTATGTENAGRFNSWSITNVDLTEQQATTNPLTISMPASNITVSATFDALYAITKDQQNGTITLGADYAAAGDNVTISASANPQYKNPVLTVFETGNESNTITVSSGAFTMPAYGVTARVVCEPAIEPLDAPVLGEATDATYQGVTLNWTSVVGNEGYVLTVQQGGVDVEGLVNVAIAQNATSYTIASGLAANTAYTYSIYTKGNGTTTMEVNTPANGNFSTEDYPNVTLTLHDANGSSTFPGSHKLFDVVELPSTAAACSKTFMGWSANAECAVAPEIAKGANYTLNALLQDLYAVYADITGGGTSTTNIAHTSASTTNMTGGNDAATYFGLDGDDWSLVGAKGNNSNYPGLNNAGDIRLYSASGGGAIITITAPQTITSVGLTFTGASYNNAYVKVGGETVALSDGVYPINATSFEIGNANTSSTASQVRISNIAVNFTTSGTPSNYSTECAAAPEVIVNPEEIETTYEAVTAGVIEVAYDNVDETNIGVALYNDAECSEAFDGSWLTASLNGDKNIAYTIAENTSYNDARTAYIKLTAPETNGATDPAVVVIPVSQVKKPAVFASLAELAAADVASGTEVTVTINNRITDIYTNYYNYRYGIYLNEQKYNQEETPVLKDIEIYFKGEQVPASEPEWVIGGTVSGTITCPWEYFTTDEIWELKPGEGWHWTDLTYDAPATVTEVSVSGTPTKDTYNTGEAFAPAGLNVHVVYSDASEIDITAAEDDWSYITWNVDPATFAAEHIGTGKSVSVTATYSGVTSSATNISSLTINAIPVSSVSLNKNAATLREGKTVQLTATIEPSNATYKTVSWESDDTDVATVSETGLVTAVAAGSATITCKSTDDATKYATCAITIVESIDFSAGDWTLVTDIDELTEGSYVIIAAEDYDYAMISYASGNNCGRESAVKNGNMLNYKSEFAIFEIQNYVEDEVVIGKSLFDVTTEAYLYSASNSSNHMKAKTTQDKLTAWEFEITSGTLKAGNLQNTLYEIQYNTDGMFSCYKSTQDPIALYKYYAPVPKVTYDKNTTDEVTNMPNPSVQRAENNKATIAAGPSRTGYSFEGWKNGNTTYTVGEEYTFTEDITLYAQWEALPSFHVTYNTSGSQGTTPTDATNYYEGDEVTLASASGLSNAGYFFAGWNDGTFIYPAGGEYTMPGSNVTFTAVWSRESAQKWALVKQGDELEINGEYIIASTVDAKTYALGDITTMGNNKVGQPLVVDRNGDIVKGSEAMVVYTLVAGNGDNTYAFKNSDNDYLMWSSGNTLNKTNELNNTSSWKISIGDGNIATIKNVSDETRKMQYNSSQPRFACYTSAQKDVQLFKKVALAEISTSVDASTLSDNTDVIIREGGVLNVNNDKTIGDLTVEAGGQVVLDANKLTVVGTFTIETTMASGKSGQLSGATVSNFEAQEDAYIDITLGDNGNPEKWHAFTVPFPVDAINGIYDLDGKKLVNEVNYAIMDYHGDIRATGKYGWKKFRGIMTPGTFYLMTVDGERTTYRFKKTANGAIVAGNTKQLYEYASSTGNNDNGWNGVGNPTLMYGTVDQNVQVLNPVSYTYEPYTAGNQNFVVGTPFFVQAASDGTMTMSAADGSKQYYAPARQAAKEIKDVKVTFGNDEYTDKLYISASEDALNEYETGKDLAKMTMTSTPKVAQIFGKAYNAKLCMVYAPMANDQAVYDLTLYAPKAGEYTIAAPAMENADLYLTYEGSIIWDLSKGEYINEFAKGNNEGYGLLLQAKMPMTPTGIEDVQGDNVQCTKVVIDEHVYILRGGQMYDVTGKAVK